MRTNDFAVILITAVLFFVIGTACGILYTRAIVKRKIQTQAVKLMANIPFPTLKKSVQDIVKKKFG